MSMNLDKLKSIFIEVLDLSSPVTDLYAIKYGEIESWDSLNHMALVGEIEDQFDVMFDTEDVLAMSEFNIAVGILKKYGVDLAA